MSQKKSVIVTVADDSLADMKAIEQRLRSAGLESGQSLSASRQFTGYVSADHEDALRKVRGVKSVDESTDYQLPPPDSPIQ